MEIIENDLWLQYAELGGVPSTEVPGFTGGNPLYTAALQLLDGDMPQYITDNSDDENSHQQFINAYLASKGADTVDLSRFATIPGSIAQGSSGKPRLTNLMGLNVDTSFWTRYRMDSKNPDLDPNFVFPQAVDIDNRTAIPRSDADTAGSFLDGSGNLGGTDHLKAIAFTAGFHFAFIEQGGTSLYPSLAQRVTSPEVLRILLSIGPTETMHFQTWQDKAGNATPLTDVDPITGAKVTFKDLTTGQPESLQSNLIMPEPTLFPQPEISDLLDHPADRDQGSSDGDTAILHRRRTFHRAKGPEIFRFAARPCGRCRRGSQGVAAARAGKTVPRQAYTRRGIAECG